MSHLTLCHPVPQHKNKAKAMKVLRATLFKLEEERRQARPPLPPTPFPRAGPWPMACTSCYTLCPRMYLQQWLMPEQIQGCIFWVSTALASLDALSGILVLAYSMSKHECAEAMT